VSYLHDLASRIKHPGHRSHFPMHLNPFTAIRLQRGAEHLHRLGPRAMAELLAELAGSIGGIPAIIGLLAEYERRLSPEPLRRVDGDRLGRRSLRVHRYPRVLPRGLRRYRGTGSEQADLHGGV
jgi:hypothetical protein